MSFNSFLSTSKDRQVALESMKAAHLVGLLYLIDDDPSIQSTSFANISKRSYYVEEEILFSMHSVFRVRKIQQLMSMNGYGRSI